MKRIGHPSIYLWAICVYFSVKCLLIYIFLKDFGYFPYRFLGQFYILRRIAFYFWIYYKYPSICFFGFCLCLYYLVLTTQKFKIFMRAIYQHFLLWLLDFLVLIKKVFQLQNFEKLGYILYYGYNLIFFLPSLNQLNLVLYQEWRKNLALLLL